MNKYEQCFRLFREGHALESILSGWNLTESEVCDRLIAGHRHGEKIDPGWLVPSSLMELAMEVIQTRDDLSPTQVSGLFKGRISPEVIKTLRTVLGAGSVETRTFSELTYSEPILSDINNARTEILIVAPEVKGSWFQRYKESMVKVIRAEGMVAFFSPHVADICRAEIEDAGICIIERATHANLCVIDRTTLWEGSGNFLQATESEEHFRRSVSRLWCDEVMDLHDLFL